MEASSSFSPGQRPSSPLPELLLHGMAGGTSWAQNTTAPGNPSADVTCGMSAAYVRGIPELRPALLYYYCHHRCLLSVVEGIVRMPFGSGADCQEPSYQKKKPNSPSLNFCTLVC
ncbi:uncharacterized protein PG998_000819 [Apiospora kogelbergensis]|uniref:uncharacterized protein n=1 Tax=Apiospora kogelbergensis TaxID=1337665 RepID=UPI0031307699